MKATTAAADADADATTQVQHGDVVFSSSDLKSLGHSALWMVGNCRLSLAVSMYF